MRKRLLCGPLRAWIAAVSIVIALLVPSGAWARGSTQVEWTRIEVPEGKDAARITKLVRKLLHDAAKKADFGKSKKLSASVRVVELTWERRAEVVRLSCTLVGTLDHGPRARSRISFGGSPEQTRELERQVLSTAANGLVTRLAELNRTRR